MQRPPRPRSAPERAAFSLLELIAALAILALLAGVVAPALSGRVAAARDARRLHDLLVVRDAIEQYRLDRGVYPVGDPAASWDTTEDGEFIPVLVDEGYLAAHILDPINDSTYQFRYHVYARGSYGCVGPGEFYVLGIRAFEDPDFTTDNAGYFACSGRDFAQEFAWVTGGGASHD